MFLIDKYTIENPWDIQYNNDIIMRLLKLDTLYEWDNNSSSKFNNLPNLLVYSQSGNGKKSLVKLLIKRIYGNNIKSKKIPYVVKGYGSNNLEVMITQSMYHMELQPTGTGLDKYLVQEIIKKYANNQIINFNNNISFKIIWIHNINKLSYFAQTALRCIMEKYYHTCKFILTGTQLTKIINPLKSRCLMVKLPAPTDKDILRTLMNISYKEDNILKLDDYNDIIKKCNSNIKEAIWLLNFKLYKIDANKDWKNLLKNIIVIVKNFINKNFKQSYITSIRDTLYKIFITNITDTEILKELLKQFLIEFKDKNLNYEIIDIATKFENSLSKGKRSIIHIEAFIYNIIDLLQK